MPSTLKPQILTIYCEKMGILTCNYLLSSCRRGFVSQRSTTGSGQVGSSGQKLPGRVAGQSRVKNPDPVPSLEHTAHSLLHAINRDW